MTVLEEFLVGHIDELYDIVSNCSYVGPMNDRIEVLRRDLHKTVKQHQDETARKLLSGHGPVVTMRKSLKMPTKTNPLSVITDPITSNQLDQLCERYMPRRLTHRRSGSPYIPISDGKRFTYEELRKCHGNESTFATVGQNPVLILTPLNQVYCSTLFIEFTNEGPLWHIRTNIPEEQTSVKHNTLAVFSKDGLEKEFLRWYQKTQPKMYSEWVNEAKFYQALTTYAEENWEALGVTDDRSTLILEVCYDAVRVTVSFGKDKSINDVRIDDKLSNRFELRWTELQRTVTQGLWLVVRTHLSQGLPYQSPARASLEQATLSHRYLPART